MVTPSEVIKKFLSPTKQDKIADVVSDADERIEAFFRKYIIGYFTNCPIPYKVLCSFFDKENEYRYIALMELLSDADVDNLKNTIKEYPEKKLIEVDYLVTNLKLKS
jgi:hypothetical protein